jgi:hypothetical protein
MLAENVFHQKMVFNIYVPTCLNCPQPQSINEILTDLEFYDKLLGDTWLFFQVSIQKY